MKKLATGIAASAMLASGLVAGAAGSAQAAPDCGYEGCVQTHAKIQDKQGDRVAMKGTSPAFIVRVRDTGGETVPTGRIKVTFTHMKSGKRFGGLTTSESYEGGKETVRPDGKLRRVGRYAVTVKFRSDGPFYGSQDFTPLKVVRG